MERPLLVLEISMWHWILAAWSAMRFFVGPCKAYNAVSTSSNFRAYPISLLHNYPFPSTWRRQCRLNNVLLVIQLHFCTTRHRRSTSPYQNTMSGGWCLKWSTPTVTTTIQLIKHIPSNQNLLNHSFVLHGLSFLLQQSEKLQFDGDHGYINWHFWLVEHALNFILFF